jgi:hypothetical protein
VCSLVSVQVDKLEAKRRDLEKEEKKKGKKTGGGGWTVKAAK